MLAFDFPTCSADADGCCRNRDANRMKDSIIRFNPLAAVRGVCVVILNASTALTRRSME